MYEEFYGLNAKPFSLLPDPSYLFLSRKHELALSILEYAVTHELVLSVVTGEVGSGKTTIVRRLMHDIDDSMTIGLISNTHRDFQDLMQSVALAFGLPFSGKDKLELYQDFIDFLVAQYRDGRRTLLIVDEAQNLDAETLEEIRLLTNINADDHMLLQLLLVGQPELHALLRRYELRQIAQRISVVAKLEPLDEKETAAYVQHRIEVAGGDPGLFHKNALRLIHWNSGGIPRVINTLCDLALVYGYADRKRRIDAMLIADIARDRIDTGLYGNRVYDVQNLKTIDAERKATRRRKTQPTQDPAPAAVATPPAAATESTAGEGNGKVFDLVVDGTGTADGATHKRSSQR